MTTSLITLSLRSCTKIVRKNTNKYTYLSMRYVKHRSPILAISQSPQQLMSELDGSQIDLFVKSTEIIHSSAKFAGKLCYSLSPLLRWAPRLISCYHKQQKTKPIKPLISVASWHSQECFLGNFSVYPMQHSFICIQLLRSIFSIVLPKVSSRYVTTLTYFIQCFCVCVCVEGGSYHCRNHLTLSFSIKIPSDFSDLFVFNLVSADFTTLFNVPGLPIFFFIAGLPPSLWKSSPTYMPHIFLSILSAFPLLMNLVDKHFFCPVISRFMLYLDFILSIGVHFSLSQSSFACLYLFQITL